jgi:hypothetical protein
MDKVELRERKRLSSRMLDWEEIAKREVIFFHPWYRHTCAILMILLVGGNNLYIDPRLHP